MKKSDRQKVYSLLNQVKEIIDTDREGSSIACHCIMSMDEKPDTNHNVKVYVGRHSHILNCIDVMANKGFQMLISNLTQD